MTIQALKEELHEDLEVNPDEIELLLAKRGTWLKCSWSEIKWLERGNMLSSITELLVDDKKMDPQRKVGGVGFRGFEEIEQDEIHVLMKLPERVVQAELRWFEKVRRLQEGTHSICIYAQALSFTNMNVAAENECVKGQCCGFDVLFLLPWNWFFSRRPSQPLSN
ncbi:hypothetical protein PHYSODRAFT_297513 [Phytophthora sojae]|uniref:Uncharacterized protein n=1 Tax=Phytophthora sojae (strain P6497) TaxID=1094619 RepID=G4YXB4_PHYSP|nr:hypothetical protein PHYSODRAFT_297513 [Phytophthora sojae]EGZ26148.1 hypothetical protein PHYSODRAFT_297513 [Phytophthora sojae]|eukprot:XP_009521436.1 hypothetical protein PHYSODRAFT_297513 [Phytophthora sojae]